MQCCPNKASEVVVTLLLYTGFVNTQHIGIVCINFQCFPLLQESYTLLSKLLNKASDVSVFDDHFLNTSSLLYIFVPFHVIH